TTTSSTAFISQQPTTSDNAIIHTMPTTSANDSTQATTSPAIEQDTQQRSADLPNCFLDNVLGDGDCLFRSIVRALYAGSEDLALHMNYLYEDYQRGLRRLIARRYQEDLHNIADEHLTDERIHEIEWDAPHIRQAGLRLDVTDPRRSMREYSLHMMQPANNNNTRYGSHLEIRYAEIVLGRRILIIENLRRRVVDGNGRSQWRNMPNEYQGIFLSPGLSAEEMGLTNITDFGQIFQILRAHNI
uniref:OTU domain-containing protein n=1 Tax=Meloidogyne javanica TaxID=6303 RepID=A0A915MWI7_MELJA